MRVLLVLCLAVYTTTVAATHRHKSSPQRSFVFYLKEKMRRVCDEIEHLKQNVNECCNQNGCMYEGKSYSHGSVFTAADGCNFCRCRDGSVECTNSSRCGQGGSSYNYRDEVAQKYCSAKASDPTHFVSAVRRNCEPGVGSAPSCADICNSGSQFATDINARFPNETFDVYVCFEVLGFIMNHPVLSPNPGPDQTDAGLLNMVTISYDTCSMTGCSVNYCCCRAYDSSPDPD